MSKSSNAPHVPHADGAAKLWLTARGLNSMGA